MHIDNYCHHYHPTLRKFAGTCYHRLRKIRAGLSNDTTKKCYQKKRSKGRTREKKEQSCHDLHDDFLLQTFSSSFFAEKSLVLLLHSPFKILRHTLQWNNTFLPPSPSLLSINPLVVVVQKIRYNKESWERVAGSSFVSYFSTKFLAMNLRTSSTRMTGSERPATTFHWATVRGVIWKMAWKKERQRSFRICSKYAKY